MYREMLEEFEQLAQNASLEELEVIAGQVLAGLEKMAEIEESENLEKEAFDPSFLGGALAVGATGIGAGVLKRKIPEWKFNRSYNQAARAANKRDLYDEVHQKKLRDAQEQLQAVRGAHGLGSVPAASAGSQTVNNTPNYVSKRKMKDPSNRVTTEIEGETRNLKDVSSDVKALQTKDWLEQNKYKLLAGGGAAAIIGKQKMDKEKQESELRGAYGVSGRGR